VSGVLEIEGNPDGTVYFDQGEITFARASWIPDLGTRLRGALPLTTALEDVLGQDELGGAAGAGDLGAALIQRNLIARDALAALLRSVIVDAVLALTLPLADGSAVSDIRFEAPGAHWAAGFGRLSVASVRAEAAALGGELARYGLTYTTPVRLCDLAEGSAMLTREQWASACRISGPASPLDLAWRHGMALYEALGCVGELVEAGLCAPCPPDAGPVAPDGAGPTTTGTGATGTGATGTGATGTGATGTAPARPGWEAWSTETPPATGEPDGQPRTAPVLPSGLPQRRPYAWNELTALGGANLADDAPADTLAPPPELLRRVLDGLRNL
jgi:hypothetical protein